MVNFGFNPASLLGIFLAIAGAGLYYLRSVRPELSRDHDIFFAAIGLLCGFILLFQGWRLDPILLFGQFILAGSAIFFAVESIRLRGVATEQAKQRTPIVDDERPVSSYYRYQAELEELEPLEERPTRGRLRGTADPRNSRSDAYEDEDRRRPPRRNSDERLGTGEQPRNKRRPRPETRPTTERFEDEWDSPERPTDDWGDARESQDRVVRKPRRPSGNRPPSSPERRPDTEPRPKRNRPPRSPVSESPADTEATPVDFQPIDRPDEESDNSTNFDY